MNKYPVTHISSSQSYDIEYSNKDKIPISPLVSVFMITYNHAKYIKEALNSVLFQESEFNYEICIGEDGSSDGTREICIEYAQKHPDKIRLFLRDRSNPNRKNFKAPFMYNVFETYKACRGKYIAMLEGDDCWTSSEKLNLQISALEADPNMYLVAHYTACEQEGKPERVFCFPQWRIENFDLEFFFSNCFFLATSSIVYRRIETPAPWIFERAMAGDTLLSSIHLNKGHGLVLPKIMSMYRKHSLGASSGNMGYHPMNANLAQWALFREIFPAKYIRFINHGYTKILCMHLLDVRKNKDWKSSFNILVLIIKLLLKNKEMSYKSRILIFFDAIIKFILPFQSGPINKILSHIKM